ncbi:MAG TPA: hypothetical protein PLU17_05780 [Chitinophagaceae bacterium]|nr:hypothetical protein [Chitinophagaceae bacterium]
MKHILSSADIFNKHTLDCCQERWLQFQVLEDLALNFSNFGRVKVPSKIVKFENGNETNLRSKFKQLKPSLIYYPIFKKQLFELTLGNSLPIPVKKYVYHLFVEPIDFNDENIIIINKDSNPLNNHIENLELLKNDIESVSSIHQIRDIVQPLSQYNKYGFKIATYQSIDEAETLTSFDKMEILLSACKSNKSFVGNFFWKFGTLDSYGQKPNFHKHIIAMPKFISKFEGG